MAWLPWSSRSRAASSGACSSFLYMYHQVEAFCGVIIVCLVGVKLAPSRRYSSSCSSWRVGGRAVWHPCWRGADSGFSSGANLVVAGQVFGLLRCVVARCGRGRARLRGLAGLSKAGVPGTRGEPWCHESTGRRIACAAAQAPSQLQSLCLCALEHTALWQPP